MQCALKRSPGARSPGLIVFWFLAAGSGVGCGRTTGNAEVSGGNAAVASRPGGGSSAGAPIGTGGATGGQAGTVGIADGGTSTVGGGSAGDGTAGESTPGAAASGGAASLDCGNGLSDSGEACDDGNTLAQDGCSSTCGVEPGWQCTSAPHSVCTRSCLGMLGNECRGGDCCESLLVPGGSFYRGYDGVTSGHTSKDYPATVSDFRLDKYPVTTGRFRRFVSAVVDGWRPLGGWGRHMHLNEGGGLTGTNADVELGWSQDWNAQLATTSAEWNSNLLHQGAGLAAWTETAGSKESRAINFITWYEAYAFCIWDGGFLPSDAEWNYAAAGGGEQRVYPWSSPPSSELIDCSQGWYSGCTGNSADVGAHSPKGDGRFGQVDLVGGGYAWNLDFTGDYSTPCVDCTSTKLAGGKSARGASLGSARDAYLASARMGGAPTSREDWFGVRCARRP